MNAAAHAGTGHQIEIYGEAGTLVLVNGSPDHMQEFRLLRAGHDEDRLREIPVAEPVQENIADSRIAPTSRLLSRFIDSILGGPPLEQNVEAALRVQHLLDAALQSDRKRGWISVLGRAT